MTLAYPCLSGFRVTIFVEDEIKDQQDDEGEVVRDDGLGAGELAVIDHVEPGAEQQDHHYHHRYHHRHPYHYLKSRIRATQSNVVFSSSNTRLRPVKEFFFARFLNKLSN